jgi:uncharacterized protein (DUF1778 family)
MAAPTVAGLAPIEKLGLQCGHMPNAEPKKTMVVKIRVDPKQHSYLEFAAAQAHLPIGTWMRQFCLSEADRLIRNAAAAKRRQRSKK